LFLWCRQASTDDAKAIFADFGKNNQAQPAIAEVSDDDLARLVLGVPSVRENFGQRIVENSNGFRKLNTVFTSIGRRFAWVPLENQVRVDSSISSPCSE